ncbi:MAG: UbiA-like protein EboC [Balneolaceae bacterium]
MTTKIRASLELMRPANIVTAFADILAGFAAVGGFILISESGLVVSPSGLMWLLLSTFGLYGGGVVFNDVFDAELDAKERPERAIPSGRISKQGASFLGAVLYAIGMSAAFQVNSAAFVISSAIVLCTLIYDAKAKHSVVWGPFFMGLCRGGNLLLGCSIIPLMLPQVWFLAFIPVIYIASITLVSQGEVTGGNRYHGHIAVGMISLVTVGLLYLSVIPAFELLPSIPFLLLFVGMVFPPFISAARKPDASHIKQAVKRGVISLVLINSVIAAGFSGLFLGLIVFGLFLLSIYLSRVFAVT